jgi:hypothetical protein
VIHMKSIRFFVLFALFLAAISTGCREKATLPTLNPVHGVVVLKDGSPVKGGTIQFQPQNDSTVSTTGIIQKDGTFSLTSFKAGIRSMGAVAGDNRVLVMPSSGGFTALSKPCVVKSGDNEVRLVVE